MHYKGDLILNAAVLLAILLSYYGVLLIKNAGEVVSKEQISEEVLGRRLASFDRSIDMHVSNIRKKIAEHIQGERIKTMRGTGYVFIQGE